MLSKSLLIVDPLKVKTIKDLVACAFANFKFALQENIDHRYLYLTTDDDFFLPPNAKIVDAVS